VDQSLLDLERCSFLRASDSDAELGPAPAEALHCWAAGRAREIGLEDQRQRCTTVLHASCPALLAALGSREPDGWLESARAARVVAEACHLAEARLEVRAEKLGPALARIFGGAG
jgi:hypothetical protein